jgi:hypothetical protein
MAKYPTFPTRAYVPEPRESRYAGTIGELLGLRGRNQAAYELARGDSSARMWNNIGEAIAGSVGMYQQQKDRDREMAIYEEDRRAQANLRGMQTKQAEAALMEQGRGQQRRDEFAGALKKGGGRDAVLKSLEADPEMYALATEHFNRIDTSHKQMLGEVAAGIRSFRDDPQAAMAAIDDLIAKGYDERQMEQYRQQIASDPRAVSSLVDALLTQSPLDAHRALVRKPQEPIRGRPGDVFIDPTTFQPIAAIPGEDNPPANPNEEALALRAAQGVVEAQKALEILKAQRPAPAAGGGPAAQRPLTQTAEAQMIGRLANQWVSVNKPVVELDRQLAIMDAGVEAEARGDVAQANEVVLQTFLKVIDPNSVVREGEFWRLQQGQSLVNRAKAAVQRITTGGWVTGEELKKYARLAHEIRDSLAKSQEPTRKRIGATAERYNIPPELIFADQPQAPDVPPPGGGMVKMRAPNGQISDVPADQVGHYESLGAKRVGG